MKFFIAVVFSLLFSVVSFSQNSSNTTHTKIPGKAIPNYKTQTNFVDNKTEGIFPVPTASQLAGSYQITALPIIKNPNTLFNVGLPFNNFMANQVKGNNVSTGNNDDKDPRNLMLSPNGNLLSPDGYEIEFRTSGNKKVTDLCATRRPYFIGGDKNASCSFTVPCDNPANRDGASTATKYFMLRWHVMLNGGASTNINQAMITSMMNTLNADYAIHNMVFCEDSAEWNEDVTNYFHDSNTEEVSMKTTYNQRPADLINIYVVGDMTAGGYARFPYDPMGGPNFRGGIVLNRSNCNASGHTLAHEMGHTFGLEHTFAGVDERTQCSSCYERVRNANGSSNTTGAATPFGGPYGAQEGDQEGDWCSDTNPHDTYSYNCSTSGNANGGCDSGPWNNAPVNNHMSYSFCSTQFTSQQRYRMHCMANSYLNSWTAYGGGICGSLPPVADFVGSPTTWQSPSSVSFTDLSQPTAIITGWSWNFNSAGQGGTVTPATFNGQNPPTIVYDIGASATCLDYEVTLTITGNGGDVEVKTSYITVCPPSGDCDTLDFQWITPTPTVTTYGLSATDNLTGIPDKVNLTLATDAKGVYEGYITPNLGVSTVGGVRVGLGNLVDADDDVTFQVVVYDDDGFGQPGALLGGRGGISPTALGVPGAGFYNEFWIPLFTPLTPTTGYFHVGVEIFSGGDLAPEDELIVMTSVDPEGEADSSNNIFSSGFGYEKIMPVYGLDLDVDVIPMLGEYTPLPIVTGFTENVVCDTTYVTIFDTLFYHDYGNPAALVGMSYTFASDGTVINTTTPLSSFNRTYTTAGPETLTITAINDCGRADTTVWTIPYNFLSTPDAEFTKVQANPICMGAPGVDFNANTSGYQDYNWDFGDGTVASSGSSSSTNHVYTTPGLYYTTLTTTSTSFQAINTFYLEDFEWGWPAGYQRFNNDAFTPNAGVNPPFTGTNATAWLPLDADGDGSTEAVSTSWNGPGEQGDDWMMTTGIGVLPANQMLTWDGEAADATYSDGYEVRISTTQLPATVANYSTVLMTIPAENSFRTTRSVSLAAYAGQTVFIAFRNNSTDQYLLYIDNIHVGTSGPGCVGSKTYTDFVEIVDCSVIPPVADMNATDSAGCAPLTITFTDNTTIGDPATSWTWNFGDATFSTLQNPPPHLYSTVGTYFVSFEACNTGGCSTEFLTVIIGSGTTALAGPDQAICGGTTATLAGNDPTPDSGAWALITGSGTPTSPTLFNTGVTGLAAGLNQFTWTITGAGCVSVDTVDITIGVSANAGIDGSLSTCATAGTTDLFTLIGVADIGGTWVPAMTSGTGVFDPSIDAAGTYQYVVIGTAPCTNDTSDVIVTITANDDPTFTYPDFCASSGGVAGVINTPGGTFSFNPDPADGSTIIPGTGAIANGVGGSIYNIQYLTPAGPCRDSLTIAVNVITAPNAGADNTLGICATGTPIDLYTLLGVADLGGTWVPAMTSGTGVFDPAIDPAGTYQYVISGAAPCGNDTADVVVTLTASDDATFIYPDFCAGSGGVAGIINTPGGSFSFDPDPLDGSIIVAGSGAISNGVAGSTYNIKYLTPAGPCQDSLTIAVNVGAPANAGTDNTLSVCATAGTTDLFTLIGVADLGGTWVPAMTSGTGVFDPSTDPAGTYQYVVTGTAPCGNDTSDVVVTVTPTDDPTFTYPDFCAPAGGVAGATNTPGGTFSFNPDPADGSTIAAGTGAISNAVGSSVYNIQYLTSGTCPDSLTIAVNVNPCIVLTASFTTSSNSICAGDSVVFTDGSTVGTTIWQWDFDSTSVGGALPSTGINAGPHTVFFNNAGTYIVELIISDGITSDTTSATITVTDCSPTADFSASQTSLCDGDCITFTDLSTNTPSSYTWSFPGGTPASFIGVNPGSICYPTSGTYDVTLTVANQYGNDVEVKTSFIVVGPCIAPTAGIIMDDADGEICVDNCIDFTYDQGAGGIPDVLNWTFEGGTPSTFASTNSTDVISVCWNDTTNIFNVSVAVSNAYGSSNASTAVVVHVKPNVFAGFDTTITIGTDGYIGAVATDTAGNVVTGGIFTWSPPTDLNCTNCQNATVVQPLNTNFYTVTYEDQYGCIVSDDVIVNLEIALNIGVPSGFSPNGDGSNDFLLVRGKIVIETMLFTIYNRYGQKVFETTDIDQGWDGTQNGKELNPGVFVYYVKVTFIDGTSGELKGNVTLVR